MSFFSDVYDAFKGVGALGAISKAWGASPDGKNIITQLEDFALALVEGQPAKINYKLPAEKVTLPFSWEGKNWTFTAEVVDGALKLSADPS